jgi:hypothetical protein
VSSMFALPSCWLLAACLLFCMMDVCIRILGLARDRNALASMFIICHNCMPHFQLGCAMQGFRHNCEQQTMKAGRNCCCRMICAYPCANGLMPQMLCNANAVSSSSAALRTSLFVFVMCALVSVCCVPAGPAQDGSGGMWDSFKPNNATPGVAAAGMQTRRVHNARALHTEHLRCSLNLCHVLDAVTPCSTAHCTELHCTQPPASLAHRAGCKSLTSLLCACHMLLNCTECLT